jgi:hypothetical protein
MMVRCCQGNSKTLKRNSPIGKIEPNSIMYLGRFGTNYQTHTQRPPIIIANAENDDDDDIYSIFSQYGATFAAVSCSTAYAVVKRPPNGIPIMLVAGAAGSLLDLTYAWNFACADQVKAMAERSRRRAKDNEE